MGVIIAVDGPAAAGKGTLARRLAAHYGLPYLDTGLLYRAVARRMLDTGVSPESAAGGLQPGDTARANLRGAEMDAAASKVAAVPEVRAALLKFQREFGTANGAVLDGRDIGTVIFPQADAKLFVTADAQERGRRRWLEMRGRGVEAELAVVIRDLLARDAADAARAAAPLVAAEDAMVLDTTTLDADAAFANACGLIDGKLKR